MNRTEAIEEARAYCMDRLDEEGEELFVDFNPPDDDSVTVICPECNRKRIMTIGQMREERKNHKWECECGWNEAVIIVHQDN